MQLGMVLRCAQRIEQRLEEDEPSELSDEDVVAFNQLFRGTFPKNSPNFILIGGAAVKYLAQAQEIVSRPDHRRTYSKRTHKDLDVYLFRPDYLTTAIEYPHELFIKRWGKNFQRVNYHQSGSNSAFYAEVLTSYAFGFPPPLFADCVLTRQPFGSVWCASPEYVMAQKLLHHGGIRAGVDDKDITTLHQSFNIDARVVAAIAQRGMLRECPTDALCACVDARSTEPLRSALKNALTALTQREYSDRLVASIGHSLLMLPIEALDEHLLGTAAIEVRNRFPALKQLQDHDWHQVWIMTLLRSGFLENPTRDGWEHLTHHYYTIARLDSGDQRKAACLAIELLHGWYALRHRLDSIGSFDTDRVYEKILNGYFNTAYRCAYIAAVNYLPRILADVMTVTEVQKHLNTVLALAPNPQRIAKTEVRP